MDDTQEAGRAGLCCIHSVFPKRGLSIVRPLVLLAVFVSQVKSQETPQEQAVRFLHANDSFGFDLLKTVHKEFPDRNIVIAPLPVSLSFAALWDGGIRDAQSIEELCWAFHWDPSAAPQAVGRTILARFEKPSPIPTSKEPDADYMPAGEPEETWLSAAFLHRTAGSLSQRFIREVEHDFGIPTGRGETQSDGRLVVLLTDGVRDVRVSGPWDKLKVEKAK